MKFSYQFLFLVVAGTFAFSVKHFRKVESHSEKLGQETKSPLVAVLPPQDRFYKLEGKLPRPEVVAEFRIIQAKVFKTDSEKARIRLAINDRSYLLELGRYLLNVGSFNNSDFKDNQDGVIDLLVEALKKGNSRAAEMAILEVILDAQVENEKLDLKIREILANSKAELMYQARDIKGSMMTNIEAQLPGPISLKIWKDVQRKPSQNLADPESEFETQERLTANR